MNSPTARPQRRSNLRFSLLTLLLFCLLAGSAGAVWIKWDAWALQRTFHADDCDLAYLALSPDGRKLAMPTYVRVEGAQDKSGPFHVYDFESGIDREIPDPTAEFAPDSRSIVSVGEDHIARIWDSETLACRATLSAQPNAIDVAHFSPDGRHIVTRAADKDHQKICLWDAASGTLRATLSGRVLQRFSPDSRAIVTTDRTTVNVFDANTGQLRFKIGDGPAEEIINNKDAPHKDYPPEQFAGWSYTGTAMSPQEHGIAISNKLLVIADRERIEAINTHGNFELVATVNDRIRLFDIQSGALTATFDIKNAWLTPACLSQDSFSPDGKWLVAYLSKVGASGPTAQFWNILDHSTQTFEHLPEAWGGTGEFREDGQFEMAGYAHDLRLNTESQDRGLPLEPDENVLFSDYDNRWTLSSGGDKVWLWKGEQRLRVLKNFQTTPACNARFSTSGQRFVCEGADYSGAVLWRTDTGDSQRLPVERRNTDFCGFISLISSDERSIVTTWGAGGEICIYRRRHPEGLAGPLAIPEFWIGVIAAIGIANQIVRAIRVRFSAPRSSPVQSASTVVN